MSFKAIVIEKDHHEFSSSITSLSKSDLLQQEGDTLIHLLYSCINYKDALALTNKAPVVRMSPMVPGIDGVGTVIQTTNSRYKEGDAVILNGWGCGETHWGCLSEYAYLKSDWLIPLPKPLTPKQSMIIGTAGYTASLAVEKIVKHGVKPENGAILVTGATGGVGSIAILLLKKLGYSITAATAKIENCDYLKKLGVTAFIDSRSLATAGKPLQKEQWSAAIDVLGSHALANVCAQIQYGGIVAACGLAQGLDLPSTVAPFILRGITLAGIDSVMAPYQDRIAAWDLLATHLDADQLNAIAHIISLEECQNVAEEMIAGKIRGRFVVDLAI